MFLLVSTLSTKTMKLLLYIGVKPKSLERSSLSYIARLVFYSHQYINQAIPFNMFMFLFIHKVQTLHLNDIFSKESF